LEVADEPDRAIYRHGVFEPLEAEKEEFHAKSVVFKEGGVHLISFGAKSLELDTGDCDRIVDDETDGHGHQQQAANHVDQREDQPQPTALVAGFFCCANCESAKEKVKHPFCAKT
jgi:hypothetical protein